MKTRLQMAVRMIVERLVARSEVKFVEGF